MTLVSTTEPSDGDSATAASVNNMINAILAVVNGGIDQDNIADLSIITSKLAALSVTGAKLAANTVTNNKLAIQPSEMVFDYIASGCVWSGDAYGSTRVASCTSGVVYIGGKRLTVAAVTSRTFTASKDVYDDLLDNGDDTAVHVYTDYTTNTASPALAANSIRCGIIVVGASNIAAATSVNQGQESMLVPIASSIPYAVTDSLGNLICPRDSSRKLLGFRRILSTFTTSATTETAITGLSVPVIVPTGRKVTVSTNVPTIQMASGAPNLGVLRLWDGAVGGGTTIGEAQWLLTNNTTDTQVASPIATVTPATASKTYNVSVFNTGAVLKTFTASSTRPLYIKVELE
jgi:hypothetical protein